MPHSIMDQVIDFVRAPIVAWRMDFANSRGLRDRLQLAGVALLVLVEVYAVYWVVTSYDFEPVVPVYQQF